MPLTKLESQYSPRYFDICPQCAQPYVRIRPIPLINRSSNQTRSPYRRRKSNCQEHKGISHVVDEQHVGVSHSVKIQICLSGVHTIHSPDTYLSIGQIGLRIAWLAVEQCLGKVSSSHVLSNFTRPSVQVTLKSILSYKMTKFPLINPCYNSINDVMRHHLSVCQWLTSIQPVLDQQSCVMIWFQSILVTWAANRLPNTAHEDLSIVFHWPPLGGLGGDPLNVRGPSRHPHSIHHQWQVDSVPATSSHGFRWNSQDRCNISLKWMEPVELLHLSQNWRK
jgi:hypothetical protein